jgi:hypothetical protein
MTVMTIEGIAANKNILKFLTIRGPCMCPTNEFSLIFSFSGTAYSKRIRAAMLFDGGYPFRSLA